LAESHYKMGLAYLNSETDYLALAEFEKALMINDKDDRVYFAIAIFYLKKNRLLDAERYAKKAIELNSDNPYYQNLLATIFAYNNNKLDAAISIWEKIADNPKYSSPEIIYFNIAQAYLQKKSYSDAEFYLKKAISANPRVAVPYMTLVDLYLLNNNIDDAIATLNNLMAINPIYLPAKLKAAQLNIKKGKYDTALNLLKEIITYEPNSKEAKEAIDMIKEIGLK
ncbi:MAG: tetratricopeptide repeat protein, partial [Deferribacterales bacterium]